MQYFVDLPLYSGWKAYRQIPLESQLVCGVVCWDCPEFPKYFISNVTTAFVLCYPTSGSHNLTALHDTAYLIWKSKGRRCKSTLWLSAGQDCRSLLAFAHTFLWILLYFLLNVGHHTIETYVRMKRTKAVYIQRTILRMAVISKQNEEVRCPRGDALLQSQCYICIANEIKSGHLIYEVLCFQFS